MSDTIPFTAIVVTYNEDEHLPECLNSLSVCDELIVVDLGSSDESLSIAEEHGARILHHERLPVVEQVRASVIDKAGHDWVLFLDPDEVFHPALAEKATSIIRENENIGQLHLPWKFYFRGEPLEGTRWGGKKHKNVFIHRGRCKLSEDVHRGIKLKDEYKSASIEWGSEDHYIKHYWIDGTQQLFEKHLRYLNEEGKSKFNKGKRFPGWLLWAKGVALAFARSYISDDGWREGLNGFLLSIFWAWYYGASLLALRRYEKTKESIG
jgi:glycosyltransferase involved in cell wall biosynthesis